MKYCPECGKILSEKIMEQKSRMVCSCGFVDWDNWVNAGVAVVAYNENNEYMMVSLKGREEGRLCFPGGYREIGETLAEAAEREMMEETGYKVESLKLYKVYTFDKKRLVWVVYIGKLGTGEFVANDETQALLLFSNTHLPPKERLRGPLTERLIQDLLAEESCALGM